MIHSERDLIFNAEYDKEFRAGRNHEEREKLILAKAEERANLKAHEERMAAMSQAATKKADAHRQTMGELNKPLPPLDGNALGRDLLKNLGLGQ